METSHTRQQVLLVDDERISSVSMAGILRSAGIVNVYSLSDGRFVKNYLDKNSVDLVLLDLNMPHLPGTEILKTIRQHHPHIPVIIVTGTKDIDTAVECMKYGALDYLVKPVVGGHLIDCVRNTLNFVNGPSDSYPQSYPPVLESLNYPDAFSPIITCSKKMRTLFRYIESVAVSSQPILITGETGVGKELIADAIHKSSGLKGDFVTVNVAGLDDTVFSDTLFGHKKGAYTGAETHRDGLVARAAGGTLFLDEIGNLSETSQVKLLRLLQQEEYYPIGSDVLKKSTARIVVATNVDIERSMAEGKFRPDLYYRLCAHRILVPPLRQRLEDVQPLAQHFFSEAVTAYQKGKAMYISDEALDLLRQYAFPGNIRELQAIVRDAVARHSAGALSASTLQFPGAQRPGAAEKTCSIEDFPGHKLFRIFDRFPTLAEVEDLLLDEALELAKGNHNNAAALLGVTRKTIANRLKTRKHA